MPSEFSTLSLTPQNNTVVPYDPQYYENSQYPSYLPDEGPSHWQQQHQHQQIIPSIDYTTTIPTDTDIDNMASAQDQIYSAQELEAFVDYGEGEEEEEEDQQYAQGSNPERPYVCMFRDERTQMICGKDYPRRCDLT